MFNRRTVSIIVLVVSIGIMSMAHASALIWKKSYGLERKGKYAQAAALIKPMADKGQDEYAVLRYAYLLYLQGKYNDSQDYYRKAMKMNNKSIDARLGLTLPLIAQQRWRQVATYTRQVLVRAPWNYTAHIRLMMAEEGMRQWHTLGKHAQAVTRVYPSDVSSWVYLARARAWMGDRENAKAAYEQVLSRAPDHIEARKYLAQ